MGNGLDLTAVPGDPVEEAAGATLSLHRHTSLPTGLTAFISFAH